MKLFGARHVMTDGQLIALTTCALRIRTILVGKPLSTIIHRTDTLCLVAGCFIGCSIIDARPEVDHDRVFANFVDRGLEILLDGKWEAMRWHSELDRTLRVATTHDNSALELGIHLSSIKFLGKHLYYDPYDRLPKFLLPEAPDRPSAKLDSEMFDLESAFGEAPNVNDHFVMVGLKCLQDEVSRWLQNGDQVALKSWLLRGEDVNAVSGLGRFWGAFQYAWRQTSGMSIRGEEVRATHDLFLTRIFQDRLFGRLVWEASMKHRNKADDVFNEAFESGCDWMRLGSDSKKCLIPAS